VTNQSRAASFPPQDPPWRGIPTGVPETIYCSGSLQGRSCITGRPLRTMHQPPAVNSPIVCSRQVRFSLGANLRLFYKNGARISPQLLGLRGQIFIMQPSPLQRNSSHPFTTCLNDSLQGTLGFPSLTNIWCPLRWLVEKIYIGVQRNPSLIYSPCRDHFISEHKN